jgi:hypothetical protein
MRVREAPSAAGPLKLRVVVTPPGAEVRLDGNAVCTAPCEVELPADKPSAQVSAAAPGYLDESRTVDAQSPPAELRFTLKRPHKAHPAGGPAPQNKNATVDPFAK